MVRQASIEVYHRIKDEGLLKGREFEIYSILFEHGPMTANEVGQLVSWRGSPSSGRSIHPRLSVLRAKASVEELPAVICPVSKNEIAAWDVTDNLPRKIIKEKVLSKKDILHGMSIQLAVIIKRVQPSTPEGVKWAEATKFLLEQHAKYPARGSSLLGASQ